MPMHVWRADMRVDPAPWVEGDMQRFIVNVPVVAIFMAIIVVGVSMLRDKSLPCGRMPD